MVHYNILPHEGQITGNTVYIWTLREEHGWNHSGTTFRDLKVPPFRPLVISAISMWKFVFLPQSSYRNYIFLPHFDKNVGDFFWIFYCSSRNFGCSLCNFRHGCSQFFSELKLTIYEFQLNITTLKIYHFTNYCSFLEFMFSIL